MATERLNILILVDFKFANDWNGRPTNLVHATKFKRFGVYYPTDANWKEKAELVSNQIIEKIGSNQFNILEASFIEVPHLRGDDWDVVFKKRKLARKFEKLLLWEDGKNPTEDRWLKIYRPSVQLIAKSYSRPFGGL